MIVVPLALAAALLVLLGFILVYGGLGKGSEANRYFCEYVRAGLIREPANTVSNFAFVAAGLVSAYLLWTGKFRNNQNPLTRNPAIAILFSSLPILLGVGSMALHASETDIGGELDLLTMYLVAGFAAAYALRRYFDWRWSGFTLAFVLAVLYCEAVGQYRQPIVPVIDYAGDAAFASLIALAVVFETLNAIPREVKRDNRWGVAALISFLAAFAVWNFGRNDSAFCRPESWWQPHALWHLLFAAALFFLFRMYVSEDSRRSRKR
ncbi:MAG TPA: ceramidase domain-containing protein [Xanthobacteraceae bacterium]|nr:ceramidase domain-containing protein [Xanthobacteraceae bacterium]